MSLKNIELSILSDISNRIRNTAEMGLYETDFVIPKIYSNDIYKWLTAFGYRVDVRAGANEPTEKMIVRFKSTWNSEATHEYQNIRLNYMFNMIPMFEAAAIAKNNKETANKITSVINEMMEKAKNLKRGESIFDITVKRETVDFARLSSLEVLEYLKRYNISAYLSEDAEEIIFKCEWGENKKMKINLKTSKEKVEETYKVGNVIKDAMNILYLITANIDGGYSIVDLNNNQVFGTYKTLEDLYINVGDENDKLINVEINEI